MKNEELRHLVIDKLLFGRESTALSDDDSFLDKGIIDSTSVLELVHLIGDDTDIFGPLCRAFGRRNRCRHRHAEQDPNHAMQTRCGSDRRGHEATALPWYLFSS